MIKSIYIVLALLIGFHAFAEEIEVPEEELARESTLPIFSKRRAVLNRNVLSTERFEIGAGGALELNEPFYNTTMFNGQGTYNFSETFAVNVKGVSWMGGLSSYGKQLRDNSIQHRPFDASKAPHPVWAVIGNLEYIAYYGKISLTKHLVMNLNTFGLAGLGYISMNTVSSVALNLGLGQNFFFTQRLGLRWDLCWLIYQGPDATTQSLEPADHPSASAFGKRIFYNAQLGAGLVFIL